MNALLLGLGAGSLEGLRRGFVRQSSESNVVEIMAAVLVLCVLVILVDQVYRARFWRREPQRIDYLAEAARVLGLSRRDVRLVRRLARGAGVAHPAALLLAPGGLAYVAAQTDRKRLRKRAGALCRRLFGCDLPAEDRLRSE